MDISEAPPTCQVLCYVRRRQWDPVPSQLYCAISPCYPRHLPVYVLRPRAPLFPSRGEQGRLWITSAWCGSIGNYVLKHWNFWDVSMVYGTIIFEVGTWEPSSTPPSSLSPPALPVPRTEGGGGVAQTARQGLWPNCVLSTRILCHNIWGAADSVLFFFTDPRVTGLLCKKKKKINPLASPAGVPSWMSFQFPSPRPSLETGKAPLTGTPAWASQRISSPPHSPHTSARGVFWISSVHKEPMPIHEKNGPNNMKKQFPYGKKKKRKWQKHMKRFLTSSIVKCMKIKTTIEYHLHILHPSGEKKMELFDDTYGDREERCLGACPTQSGCGDRYDKLMELLEDDHKELPPPSRTHSAREIPRVQPPNSPLGLCHVIP